MARKIPFIIVSIGSVIACAGCSALGILNILGVTGGLIELGESILQAAGINRF